MIRKVIIIALIAVITFPAVIARRSFLKEITLKKEVEIETSFYYTPEPNQDFYLNGSYEEEIKMNGNGKTCSGEKARPGIVAADLKVLPLGTIFRVLDEDVKKLIGREIYEVADKGSAIKAKLVDFHTGKGPSGLKKALKIEKRRKVKIEIIKWGDQ